METKVYSVRLPGETARAVCDLAKQWGPVKPLTLADVVRECVRRVHEAETKKRRNGDERRRMACKDRQGC